MKRMRLSSTTAVLLLAVALSFLGGARNVAHAADRIVLRNLKVLTDKSVTSFDEDGVRLNDTSTLEWHEIERAKISPDQQAAFDAMLSSLGGDLHRIRQRLGVGDYAGLLPQAEALEPRYRERRSGTAYMVLQALMWGRLATGQREAALAPYLRCYDLVRARGAAKIDLPGERRLLFDPATGLSPELTPVWFDVTAAQAAQPLVLQAIRTMQERPEGVVIYFASLASAAGDDAAAERVLPSLRATQPPIAELRDIVAAQREVLSARPGPAIAKLQANLQQFSADNQALGLYWVGRQQLASSELDVQQQGLLDLLRIPAIHGTRQPELSGAALLAALTKLAELKDVRGSVALRGELLSTYGGTYAAKRLQRQATPELQP